MKGYNRYIIHLKKLCGYHWQQADKVGPRMWGEEYVDVCYSALCQVHAGKVGPLNLFIETGDPDRAATIWFLFEVDGTHNSVYKCCV